MINHLDKIIPLYSNAEQTTPAKHINLFDALTLPDMDLYPLVDTIRNTESKSERDILKRRLPAYTISGEFRNRNKIEPVNYTNLICLDIDRKNNEHIRNFDDLKWQIGNLNVVAYCGLSVSGRGLMVIIPVSNPASHYDHWYALQADFARFGIAIDQKAKAPNQLRFYSIDEDPFVNADCEVYTKLTRPLPKPATSIGRFKQSTTQDQVNACIDQITLNRIDITDQYHYWVALGCSFASEFGEAGRQYFHAISQFHHEYDPRKTDRQFDACLRSRYNNTMAVFFGLCKDHGIYFKNPKTLTL